LPEAAAPAAAVQRWLSVASGEIAFGPAAARSIVLFNAPRDPKEVIARAHAALDVIDKALIGRSWGNVDLGGYAQIGAWLRRVEGLPGFVPFKTMPVGLRAVSV